MAKLDLSIIEDRMFELEIQVSKDKVIKGSMEVTYKTYLKLMDGSEDLSLLPKMLFGEEVYEEVIENLSMPKVGQVTKFCFEELTKFIKGGEESPSE